MTKKIKKVLFGLCTFHSETGTEGGYWAFQDKDFIFPDGQWSFSGLYILKNGDFLTIFSPNDRTQIVWSGAISLNQLPLFTEDAFGLWIHTDQNGIDRNVWAKYFLEEYPAVLITDKKINPDD